MKTFFTKTILLAAFIPFTITAQTDLTIGLNYSYDPPSNCNNLVDNIEVDICNNGSGSAGSFLVGIYLYLPSTQEHWVLDQTTCNSLSGNACVTISNWDINMNNYPSLPAPGTGYRIGVWADTANVISESDENNNSSLLSGNIQVCATSTGLKLHRVETSAAKIFPNPVSGNGKIQLSLLKAEELLTVSIFDVTGKLVNTLYEGAAGSGKQTINFDSGTMDTGIYFVKVSTSAGTQTSKLVVQH